VKKALILCTSFLLSALLRAQDILPLNDLPFELPVANFHNTLLFNDWVRASVQWQNPLLRNDSSLWFDFDKASQRLLVTTDKKTEFLFDRREFQSVTFYFGIAAFTFLHVPVINDKDLFYEVVRSPHGYSLYKSIHPKAWKDGFVDVDKYYIVFPFPNVRVLRLSVPDKWILDRALELSGDKEKLDRYFDLHRDEEQSEHFLKGLIEFLNQSR
jgi:hypothetical protein